MDLMSSLMPFITGRSLACFSFAALHNPALSPMILLTILLIEQYSILSKKQEKCRDNPIKWCEYNYEYLDRLFPRLGTQLSLPFEHALITPPATANSSFQISSTPFSDYPSPDLPYPSLDAPPGPPPTSPSSPGAKPCSGAAAPPPTPLPASTTSFPRLHSPAAARETCRPSNAPGSRRSRKPRRTRTQSPPCRGCRTARTLEPRACTEARIAVKLNANRMVVGTLRGFDQFMNLVIDNTVEVNGNEKNDIGMVRYFFQVIRGNSVVTIEALEPVARS
nr:probable small nuclear ribonucleoprotein G [Ipomoea trifida]